MTIVLIIISIYKNLKKNNTKTYILLSIFQIAHIIKFVIEKSFLYEQKQIRYKLKETNCEKKSIKQKKMYAIPTWLSIFSDLEYRVIVMKIFIFSVFMFHKPSQNSEKISSRFYRYFLNASEFLEHHKKLSLVLIKNCFPGTLFIVLYVAGSNLT